MDPNRRGIIYGEMTETEKKELQEYVDKARGWVMIYNPPAGWVAVLVHIINTNGSTAYWPVQLICSLRLTPLERDKCTVCKLDICIICGARREMPQLSCLSCSNYIPNVLCANYKPKR